jgi:hypothetical protein
MTANSILLNAAREYLARGLSIIPVIDKKAAIKWEQFQTQRPSPDVLPKWFSIPNVTGLAFVLGEVSGWLYCRDFDAAGAYTAWAAKYPIEARSLPTVQTGRTEGRHVYFKHTGVLRTAKLDDGEMRGQAGYCVAPPSIHPEGIVYAWAVPLGKSVPFAQPEQCGLSRCWKNDGNSPTACVTSVGSVALCASVDSVHSVLSVRSVVGEQLEKQLENLAADFAAKEEHHNHSLLWNLARGVRGLERNLGRKVTRQEEDLLFSCWHELSKPHLRPEDARDDYRSEFLDALRNAKHPHGEGVTLDAMRKALNGPLPAAGRYESPHYRRAVAVCAAAQRVEGGRPFFLSARTLRDLLGLDDHSRAASILRVLERDGILQVVEKGSPKTNKATRFRYLNGGSSHAT